MTGVRVPSRLRRREPEMLATDIGLCFCPDEQPGITRRRRGSGFSYHEADGKPVGDDERERLESLAVPPAWTDTWLAPAGDCHILATGRDDQGRKQYIYHPEFRAEAERLKFGRLAYFGKALRRIRPTVFEILQTEQAGDEEFALAAATRLVDSGLLRVGSGVYHRTSGTQGATTLIEDAVERADRETGTIELSFAGKGGKHREVSVDDSLLAETLDDLLEIEHDALFVYYDDNDATRTISSGQLNTWIAGIIGPAFTAKDFRTWGGTVAAATAIVDGKSGTEVFDHAAEALGNTRAVARSSYVAPAIPTMDEQLLDAYSRSRRGRWLSRVESAVEKTLRSAVARCD